MNYSIEGEPLPVVICNLEANETMIVEYGKQNLTMNWKKKCISRFSIAQIGRSYTTKKDNRKSVVFF